MLKDLSAYFEPPLELPVGDRVFVSQPPSKDTGLKLATINAVGVAVYSASLGTCQTCGRDGNVELPDETKRILESVGDTDVAELALGKGTYDEMIEAGVPAPHIDTLGLYALYYWTVGEDTADQIMAARHGGQVEQGPKA